MVAGFNLLVTFVLDFFFAIFSFSFMQDVRESKYVQPLDNGFKKFIQQKMNEKTPKEKMESRAGGFGDNDLVALAKTWGCVLHTCLYFSLLFFCFMFFFFLKSTKYS